MVPHRLDLMFARNVSSFASQPIAQIGDTFLFSAMGAAIIGAILFQATIRVPQCSHVGAQA